MNSEKYSPQFIQNLSTKEASINLFSEIGGDGIQGQAFADEMSFLNNVMKVDTINIHLASDGGSVSEGLIIYHSILGSKARTNIFIEGIAASMGGVIAMAGDRIHMTDASQLMIHMPHAGTSEPDENTLKAIAAATESLLVTINNRSKVAETTIAKLMQEETWINPVDALNKYGLIDEIVPTKKQKDKSKEAKAAMAEILNKHNFNNINNTIKNDMKNIATHLGLNGEAPETAIIDVIKAIEDSLKTSKEDLVTAQTTVATLTDDKATLEAKIVEFESSAEAVEATIVEETVEEAIDKGTFKKEAKEDLVAQFKGNSVGLKAVIGNLSGKSVNVIDKLKGAKPTGEESKLPESLKGKTWGELFRSGDTEKVRAIDENEFNSLYSLEYGVNHPDFIEA